MITLIDLPQEIIILICQYMKADTSYYEYGLNRWHGLQYQEMFNIYDLVSTCTSFGFLKDYSFLLCIEGEYDDIFPVINYLGDANCMEYRKFQGEYSGYCDDIHEIYVRMPASNYGYYMINDVKYEFDDIDYDNLFVDVYKNFDDQEIIKFLNDLSKSQFGLLIRKSFPKINISKGQMDVLVRKYRI